MNATNGMRIRINAVAPANAQFLGSVGTVQAILPNALMVNIDGHGNALILRGWGTKKNPGDLTFDVLSA